jgi:hypothetical protein
MIKGSAQKWAPSVLFLANCIQLISNTNERMPNAIFGGMELTVHQHTLCVQCKEYGWM